MIKKCSFDCASFLLDVDILFLKLYIDRRSYFIYFQNRRLDEGGEGGGGEYPPNKTQEGRGKFFALSIDLNL